MLKTTNVIWTQIQKSMQIHHFGIVSFNWELIAYERAALLRFCLQVYSSQYTAYIYIPHKSFSPFKEFNYVNMHWMSIKTFRINKQRTCSNQSKLKLKKNLQTYLIFGRQIGCDGYISIDNNRCDGFFLKREIDGDLNRFCNFLLLNEWLFNLIVINLNCVWRQVVPDDPLIISMLYILHSLTTLNNSNLKNRIFAWKLSKCFKFCLLSLKNVARKITFIKTEWEIETEEWGTKKKSLFVNKHSTFTQSRFRNDNCFLYCVCFCTLYDTNDEHFFFYYYLIITQIHQSSKSAF